MKILGVEIKKDKKKISYALCAIKGIGISLSRIILKNCNIDINKKTENITFQEIGEIENYIKINNIMTESLLKKNLEENIKRLKEMKSYRGFRHALSLPCRGQRTSSNAKTVKNQRKADIRLTFDLYMNKIKIKKIRKKQKSTVHKEPKGRKKYIKT